VGAAALADIRHSPALTSSVDHFPSFNKAR